MSNSYSQIHIQLVFAVKYRQAQIDKLWKERLHQYLTGIIESNRHKVLQINSMPDHVHILIGLRTHQSLSTLVKNVKVESTKWIKSQRFCATPFAWQEGYSAFSYSKSYVEKVIQYIKNQEIHHQKENFLVEYRKMLTLFEIQWDENYIFKSLE